MALLNRHKPELVINVALPYQDLTIMEACLQCGVNYLDTANYEPKDVAHFEYSWQWAYRERFEQAGLCLICIWLWPRRRISILCATLSLFR